MPLQDWIINVATLLISKNNRKKQRKPNKQPRLKTGYYKNPH